MKSTNVEMIEDGAGRRTGSLSATLGGMGLGVLGALAALAIGLLTFGAQATVAPSQLPLAIGASDPVNAPALGPLTVRIAAQGGSAVAWRTVDSRAAAERMLDRKEVYGAVLFSPGHGGLHATVLLSGAVNPSATQAAQPVLTRVAQVATTGGPGAPPIQVATLHPTSVAGRVLPLAASALLWLATLISSLLAVAVGPRLRNGRPLGRTGGIGAALTGAVLATGGILGCVRLWDASVPIGWETAAFMALVGVAFGLLQAGVLRWLGLGGAALLVPLYLTAPAVAGQVPELLNPVYRDVLWSWTPFRFSTEALRSLIFLGSDAPDVQPALWLFGAIAAVGLVLLLIPGSRRSNRLYA
jgi:hypothetical protein